MRRAALALLLPLAAGAARAEEGAAEVPQGTEGLFCWQMRADLPPQALYRRRGSLFCATRRAPPETVRTVAAVGPDRAAVKRAVLDAFAWARPASDFTEGHAAEPDIVVVATAAPTSTEAVLTDLAAQGFRVGDHMRKLIATFDRSGPLGSGDSQGAGSDGRDGPPGFVERLSGDRMSTADARGFVAERLGVVAPLHGQPEVVPNLGPVGRFDPRVFVPAAGGQP